MFFILYWALYYPGTECISQVIYAYPGPGPGYAYYAYAYPCMHTGTVLVYIPVEMQQGEATISMPVVI